MSGSSSGNGVAGRMDSDGNATDIGDGGAGIDNIRYNLSFDYIIVQVLRFKL